MADELRLRPGVHRDRQCNLFHRKIFITSNDFYMHLDYMLESRKAEAKNDKFKSNHVMAELNFNKLY
jgi:hypothetical protein